MLLAAVLTMSFSRSPDLVAQAETGSYISNISSAPWRDRFGSYDNRTDYSKAPFHIEDGEHTILLSAGCHPADTVPRLGSHNPASYAYHDLDDAALASFRSLTGNKNAAVMVLETPLLNAAVTGMTFSWSATTGGTQDVHYIHSYDGGAHWHIDASGTTQDQTTIEFTDPLLGNHVQVGVLLTYATPSYRYVTNPGLSIQFRSLTAQEQATALMDLVAAYSPCETDNQGLLLADGEVAANFHDQYQSLSSEAKVLFDSGMIDETTSHRERLDFIVDYHQLEPLAQNAQFEKHKNIDEYALIIIWLGGVLGYAAGKRKREIQ
ncbi:MAG: hypothetical protein WC399_01075 [Bacilli bacterium]|jgi:hypothetical protein